MRRSQTSPSSCVAFAWTLFCLTCLVPGLSRADDERPLIDTVELDRRLTELEGSAAEAAPVEIRPLVEQFARAMVHARVQVESARVIATYTRRGWKTRPYFAVDYVPVNYVYTDELDPRFQEELAGHLHWVSMVKSMEGRQLMFELAIDEATYQMLHPQDVVSFTCEIAGVIRGGRSVYSRLVRVDHREPHGADGDRGDARP